jgi:hypothetical protein
MYTHTLMYVLYVYYQKVPRMQGPYSIIPNAHVISPSHALRWKLEGGERTPSQTATLVIICRGQAQG